jgi:LmbE family N-acetylglucosaminyl deacetylase
MPRMASSRVVTTPASTIVFLHAHPDDEVLLTGGSIARAAAEGRRVVLIVATNGEHGEVPDDLGDGESIVDRRRRETECSATVLGIDHVLWLGYSDSGMTGWDQNAHPESLWQADVDDAAARLAKLLETEHADVLVTYDWHGGYGHPDHVQVHRVGHRAAAIAGTPRVLEATFNRDAARTFFAGGQIEFDPDGPADDGNPVGTPEIEIHYAVDVTEYTGHKRRALACHASQSSDAGEFLAIPEAVFAAAFGTEWFTEPGRPPGLHRGWLFD